MAAVNSLMACWWYVRLLVKICCDVDSSVVGSLIGNFTKFLFFSAHDCHVDTLQVYQPNQLLSRYQDTNQHLGHIVCFVNSPAAVLQLMQTC